MREIFSPKLIRILQIVCALLLAGRAWEHFFFDPPYRAIFWNPVWMSFWVEGVLGMTWEDFLAHPHTDPYTQTLVRWLGVCLLLAAMGSLLAQRKWKIVGLGLWISALILAFHNFCAFANKGYQIAQLIEQAAQIFTPILLYLLVYKRAERVMFFTKIAIALTFLGHGLYAMGFHPVPGIFIEMFVRTLGFTEAGARTFLWWVGWLDIVVAVGIFVPKLDQIVLAYAIVWGFLTAFARLTSFVSLDYFFWISLHQWLFEFLVRIPHFMLPILVAYHLGLSRSKQALEVA